MQSAGGVSESVNEPEAKETADEPIAAYIAQHCTFTGALCSILN